LFLDILTNYARSCAVLSTHIAVNDEIVVNRPSGTSHKLAKVTDITLYGLILSFGALQFGLAQRATDFFRGDTIYFELARSIIREGFYGFNSKPETLLPPGFPVILAGICVTVGCSYLVLVRSMAVFATLGLIASYQLLRREQGRVVAVVSCLLLGSSPIFFEFTTRMVFSDLPYMFTSMLALVLALRLDTAKNPPGRTFLWLLCGLLIGGSLLIRSSGIALLVGLLLWLAVSRFAEREVRLRRLRTFAPLLLMGLFVGILWMQWAVRHEVLQWPMVGGYPQPYVAQLSVKNGNYPELGTASLSDILPRVTQNLVNRAGALSALLTRMEYINPAWFSPAVFGPVLLILVGVGSSIWHGGGNWPVWYFLIHEAMYLLWPWNFEMRFFLPVAPLACLYLWRGGKVLLDMASRKPREVGVWSFLLSLFLGVCAAIQSWNSSGMQLKLATAFWALLAVVSFWIARNDMWQVRIGISRSLSQSRTIWGKSVSLLTVVSVFIVIALVGVGLVQQLRIGRDNLTFDVTRQRSYPDIEAAQWIGAHTASTVMVMARQIDVVYHYSRRNVLWFPPLSNPHLLMDGIRNHEVKFVIVTSRKVSYWLPPDQDCFEPLVSSYPRAFELVHEGPQFRIFEVVSEFS
jgi:hypothetical protein